MKNERYYLIDIFKFLFTLMIAVFHFWGTYGQPARGGFIAVEFFFIVSGFFLMKKYKDEKIQQMTSIQYIGTRIKKYYPHYIYSFLVMFIFNNILWESSVSMVVHNFVNQWSEIILLHGTILSDKGTYIYNSMTWYISIMLIVSYVLWILLKRYESSLLSAAPVIVFWIYAYMIYTLGTTNNWRTHVFEIFNYGAFRAIAGMLLGITVYHASQCLQNRKHVIGGGWLGAILIGFAYVASYYKYHAVCFCYIMIFALGLIMIISDKKIYTIPKVLDVIIGWCTEITYAVYLNHYIIRSIMKEYLFPDYHASIVAIYLLLLLIYSTFTTWLIKVLKGYITMYRKKI